MGKTIKKGFKINRVDRFKSRTRYFTESGIIGTKAFVSARYQQFRDYFYSGRDKVPNAIVGPDGICSLKKLAE